jgi:sulfate adenylyltransferase/3'-phosphoadenosine 5'-phosphosulfate synthase
MSLNILNNSAPRGFTIWLTGLSGAGKTTLAEHLAQALAARGRRPEILDGDVVRTHLSKGLGFSREDRDTNIRRIAFVSSLVTRQGGVVIVAAISPYRDTRAEARQLIRSAGGFVEVYVRCPLEELVRRDVKGLYARALRGEIANFTGVSDPYEEPQAPEVIVDTDRETVDESAAKVLAYLDAHGYLPSAAPSRPLESPASPAVAAALGSAGRAASNGHLALSAPSLAVTPAGVERPRLFAGLGEPHGGVLVQRQAPPEVVAEWDERIRRGAVPAYRVSARVACDLELLANGGFSPLQGFLGQRDYRSVVHALRLTSGLVWPIPVVLGVDEADAARWPEGQDLALLDDAGRALAVLHVQEKYRLSDADVRTEALEVYRTDDEAHPGVRALYARGRVLVAGPITGLHRVRREPAFEPYRLDPVETRWEFAQRGWRSVVGFQTRNPVHRAHEYLLKTALESVDGLLLHPLVGETKDDDVPAAVRLRCYEALLAGYFPADRVLLSVLPAAMRYAGPREAVFHALIRKNYGCTHFIVGRDHAGVGNYYGPYDAQLLLQGFSEAELGIRPIFFEHAFYCTACGGMASVKTCPHAADHHVTLSGTKVRALLAEGKAPPPEFSRPEVARVLVETRSEKILKKKKGDMKN